MRLSPDPNVRRLSKTRPYGASVAVAYFPPTVLAVHLGADLRDFVEDAAAQAGLRLVGVRHLQAACAALAANPCVAVLADEGLPSWDRAVLTEHAARHGATVSWLDSYAAYDLVGDILRVVRDTRRDRRSAAS
jgi:hypothetical protein